MFSHWNYKHKALCISDLTIHRPLVMAIGSTQFSHEAEMVLMGSRTCWEPGFVYAGWPHFVLFAVWCWWAVRSAKRSEDREAVWLSPRNHLQFLPPEVLMRRPHSSISLTSLTSPRGPRFYPWSSALATKFAFSSEGEGALFLLFPNKELSCYFVKDNVLYGVNMCAKYSFLICLTNYCVSLCKVGELCFENCIFVCGMIGWKLDLVNVSRLHHNLENKSPQASEIEACTNYT